MTSSSQDELELPEDAQHGVSRGCPVVMVISRPISGHVHGEIEWTWGFFNHRHFMVFPKNIGPKLLTFHWDDQHLSCWASQIWNCPDVKGVTPSTWLHFNGKEVFSHAFSRSSLDNFPSDAGPCVAAGTCLEWRCGGHVETMGSMVLKMLDLSNKNGAVMVIYIYIQITNHIVFFLCGYTSKLYLEYLIGEI